MAESVSLSRPTSVSRASRSGSARSRSLIKKNIESQDLNAADLLIERFTAWKIIVKQLASYFEGVADIENSTAREMTKIAGIIQVPFRSGNQFLGEGGLQDVFYGIRDKTRQMADQHADLGRTIDSSIVQHLQKLLVEIKAHLKNVQNDTAKLASSVAKERETSTKLIGELANGISTFRNTPMILPAKADPYLVNQAVAQQLNKQVLEENLLQKSIIVMQQNSAHFENGIVRAIQSAWQTFDEWNSRAANLNQEVYRSLSAHMASLSPDHEWISFAARSDHLVDPDTPLRDPSLINYPCKDDPSVSPVHTGHLERKKRYSRSYEESYFVLTPAGYLHAFNNSDPSHPSGHGLNPVFSLFLPNCTLGPPSSASSKAHKFHIEGRKDGTGTTKSGSLRGLLGDNTLAWSFRARSREEMMEWWNDMRMLCARYLVASEQIERSGPVEHAVRSAGYDDASEEGSSIEEVDESYPETTITTRPSGYEYDKRYSGAEMGPHGYIKKGDSIDDTHVINTYPSPHKIKTAASPFPHTMYDTLPAPAVQDTILRVTPQTTGASFEPSTHTPRVVQSTGYVPDELALENGYTEHTAHDPHHFERTPGSPLPVHMSTPTPTPGLGLRTNSPRGSAGRLSPHHTYAIGSRTASPQPAAATSPRAYSPREGASSPVYASGITAPQYPATDTENYDPATVVAAPPILRDKDTVAAEPVTTSYTGDAEDLYATRV